MPWLPKTFLSFGTRIKASACGLSCWTGVTTLPSFWI